MLEQFHEPRQILQQENGDRADKYGHKGPHDPAKEITVQQHPASVAVVAHCPPENPDDQWPSWAGAMPRQSARVPESGTEIIGPLFG